MLLNDFKSELNNMKNMKKYNRSEQDQMRGMTIGVKMVADMQRDLDAYSFSFANIIGWLGGKFGKTSLRPAIMSNLAASDEVNRQINLICEYCINAFKKIRELESKLNNETTDKSS